MASWCLSRVFNFTNLSRTKYELQKIHLRDSFSTSPSSHLSLDQTGYDDIVRRVERHGEDLVPEEVDHRVPVAGEVQGRDPGHELPVVGLEPGRGAVEEVGLVELGVGDGLGGEGGVVVVEVDDGVAGHGQVGRGAHVVGGGFGVPMGREERSWLRIASDRVELEFEHIEFISLAKHR